MNKADEPRSLVKKSPVKIPPELANLFNDPPLIGDEKREDYENLFSAIVADFKPRQTVVWLLARDITDLTWEIEREKNFKSRLIRLTELEVVSKLLSPLRPSMLPSNMSVVTAKTDKVARQWAGDAEARQRVTNKLADMGYDAPDISTLALNRAALEREAIDRRIDTYQQRRRATLKEIELYSKSLARQLAASVEVIEGEFTEAAE